MSVFIVAGDKFVVSRETFPHIYVRTNSIGYDGQFYYEIALNPFAGRAQNGGVTLDHPAWRLQRILYPLLSYLVALGQPRVIPFGLFAANLVSLFAILFTVARLVRSRVLSATVGWAIVLWPGFLISLAYDTTEILASALLLGALLAYTSGRRILFSCLAALALLTRETSSLMLVGIIAYEMTNYISIKFACPRRTLQTPDEKSLGFVLYAGIALVPFALLHIWLALHWPAVAELSPVGKNLGMPLVGVATRLFDALQMLLASRHLPPFARFVSAYTVGTILTVVAFGLWVAASAPVLWQRGARRAGVMSGWLCMIALISLLSAVGPWIEPKATFRAFSECWVAGCLLLSLDNRTLPRLAFLGYVPLAFVNGYVCIKQL